MVGRLSDQGGIGGLAGSDSDSELESSLGGPGGLGTAEMNFLGALEIPSSKNGSSCRLGCSVSALVGGIVSSLSGNGVDRWYVAIFTSESRCLNSLRSRKLRDRSTPSSDSGQGT